MKSVANEILHSAVVVDCKGAKYGIRLVVLFDMSCQFKVSGLLKQAGLEIPEQKNSSAWTNADEYRTNFAKNVIDRFNVAVKLDADKEFLSEFFMQIKNSDTVLNGRANALIGELSKVGSSELCSLKALHGGAVACTAYFGR